jgi:hypothetical protein
MLIYSFRLHIYTIFWVPQSLGFVANYSSGSMIVTQVSSQGAVARGRGRSEFRQGDRLEALLGRYHQSRAIGVNGRGNFRSGQPRQRR